VEGEGAYCLEPLKAPLSPSLLDQFPLMVLPVKEPVILNQ
jgi:hypothetical protein